MNPDAGLVYSYYKDGALAPTFVYIKAGYKITKVRAWLHAERHCRCLRTTETTERPCFFTARHTQQF